MYKLFPAYNLNDNDLQRELQEETKRSDKIMLFLILANWIIVAGVTSLTYGTYSLGIIGGGIAMLLAFVAYKAMGGTPVSRIIMGMMIMIFPIIMIQQQLGLIEMHFHVFVVLAILTIYKDILPLLAAAGLIAVHHLLFTYLQLEGATFFGTPVTIFNYACGYDIAFLHAAFVVMESAVLIYIINMVTNQFISAKDTMNVVSKISETNDLTHRVKEIEEADVVFNRFMQSLTSVINTTKQGSHDNMIAVDTLSATSDAISEKTAQEARLFDQVTANGTDIQSLMQQTVQGSDKAKENIAHAKAKLSEARDSTLNLVKNDRTGAGSQTQ